MSVAAQSGGIDAPTCVRYPMLDGDEHPLLGAHMPDITLVIDGLTTPAQRADAHRPRPASHSRRE